MGSIYRGCKYIVTVRDPAATTRSFYNFFLSKKVPFLVDVDVDVDGTPKIKMDVSQFLMDMPFVQGIPEQKIRASIWEYYYEYHQLLACREVLILVYEDVVQDMPTAIQQIGCFMGLLTSPNTTTEDEETTTPTTDHVIRELITRMTTKDYMAQYMSKFDEPYERAKHFQRSADLCQLAPGHKIRIETNAPQTHQQQQQFSNEAHEFLTTQWNKTMNNKDTDNCNYASYHDFVETIRKRNTSLFGYE